MSPLSRDTTGAEGLRATSLEERADCF